MRCGLRRPYTRQLDKGGSHAVPHDNDDFVNALRVIEALPRVGHDGPSGDFEKQFLVTPGPMRVPLPAATRMALFI